MSHLILKTFRGGGPRPSKTGRFLALPAISCAESCLWSFFKLWCTFCCYSLQPLFCFFFCYLFWPFLLLFVTQLFFLKIFFLYFFSVPFSFLPFTLKNRKTSSCKVRLRLVWDQGGCCCSRCAGIASRVLVGRVSMLNPQGAQTAVLTSSGKSNMWNLEGQDWGFLPDISTCEETQRRARGGQDS